MMGVQMAHKDIEARRAYQREYQRKWREANKDKARQISRKFEEAHREERRAEKRAYYAENSVELLAKKKKYRDPEKYRAYYLANKEKIAARGKAYRALNSEATRARNKKWFEENKERKHDLDKQWRTANKERITANRHARDWKLKHEVWAQYGGAKCACCGATEQEFLTVDHVNGGGAKHRKEIRENGSQDIYSWLKKHNFPDKHEYRVLCMNCNWAFGMYGRCPHHPTETNEGESPCN